MSEHIQSPIRSWDSQNQRLVSTVHPADWKNPTPAPRYNLVVIGSGTAGLGAKVALIENGFMGGDCLNVPAGMTVDFGTVMERMRRLRADISPQDSAKRYSKLGVDVFLGAAKFTGSDSIEVGGQTLRFANTVIATGARAAAPPIPGWKGVPSLTNETFFSLAELPQRLGIIDAGPIGCEMAQCFARLGSEVFLVEAGHGILPREGCDASGIIQKAMVR